MVTLQNLQNLSLMKVSAKNVDIVDPGNFQELLYGNSPESLVNGFV
jgi:hypothetical protein